MTKQRFLDEIDASLYKLNKKEREDIKRDFEEYFENGIREGKSEKEIVEAFGPVDELIQSLLEAYNEEDFVEEPAFAHNDKMSQSQQFAFTKVQIKSKVSDCIVEPSPNNEPHIFYNNEETVNKPSMEIIGDTLEIKVKNASSYLSAFSFGLFSKKRERVRIQLPIQTYEEIKVKNEAGNISIEHLQSNDFHLRNETGRIQVSNVLCKDLDVKNSAGSILLEKVFSKNARCKSSAGKMNITNSLSERWNLKSEAGHTMLENVRGEIKGHFEVGSVQIVADKIVHAHDIKTEVGKVNILTDEPLKDVTIRIVKEFGTSSIYGENETTYQEGTGKTEIRISNTLGKVIIDTK